MTQREFETLQAILHHVGCYNGWPTVNVKAHRLPITVGLVPGSNVLAVAPGPIVIDGVEHGPVRGRSA